MQKQALTTRNRFPKARNACNAQTMFKLPGCALSVQQGPCSACCTLADAA